MKFTNPSCLNCNATIGQKEINLKTDVASCPQCGTIYKFSNLLYSKQSNSHKDTEEVHDGFIYEDFKMVPSMTIQLKKMSNYKFQFSTSIVVGVMSLFFLIIPSLISKFIGLIIVYFVVYLVKEGLYRYRTIYTIELSPEKLRIYEGNSESFSMIPDRIAQVYVKRRDGGSSNRRKYMEHDLYIRPKSGDDVKILKHILPAAVAFQIERIIEKSYSIEDIITKEEYHPVYSPEPNTEIPPKALEIMRKLNKSRNNG